MIADPPLLTGAVHVNETCVLPAIPATPPRRDADQCHAPGVGAVGRLFARNGGQSFKGNGRPPAGLGGR